MRNRSGETGLPVGRQRSQALAVLGCVLVIDILDLTIVNVAIPTLQVRLAVGDAAVQWLVAGYATIFAVLIVSGGRLGDIYGYRRMLSAGLIGFVAASIVCGAAPDATWLVIARLVQGAAAAMMLPQIGSLVQLMYAPHERVGALGMFGVLGGTAAVAGPLIGGLLISADLFGLGWRPIFLVNVPVGLGVLIAARRLLPKARSAYAPRLDVPGTMLMTALLVALMVPLVQGRALGWPVWSLAMLGCVPPLLFATFAYSRWRMPRDGSALLVLDLFRERSFSLGVALIVLFQMTIAGLLFILTLVLQDGLRFSPGRVGLVHGPFALGVALGIGVLSRRILPRIGPKLVAIGAAIMAFGLLALRFELAGGSVTLWTLMPTMALTGLGMGVLSGPLSPIALSEVDVAHAGAASGMMRSLQEIGGALGIAGIGGTYLMASAGGSPVTSFERTVLAALSLLAVIFVGALFLPSNLRVFGRRPSAPPGNGSALT